VRSVQAALDQLGERDAVVLGGAARSSPHIYCARAGAAAKPILSTVGVITAPPPGDTWAPGAKASDVPVVEGGGWSAEDWRAHFDERAAMVGCRARRLRHRPSNAALLNG
jgi:hypothetical protein